MYYNSIEGDYMTPHKNADYSPPSDGDPNNSGSDSEADAEKVFTRHKVGEALSKADFGDVLVLSHEAADQALTPSRRDVIEALATNHVGSLRELADVLGRDPGNLTRDMKILVAEDIARYREEGKAKRPELKHDTIVVEPLVASEEPLPDVAALS